MVFTLAVIGGSGLLKSGLAAFRDLSEETVDTSAGRVFLRSGPLRAGVRLVFVQRHDATPSRAYTQPSDINYAAIALALKAVRADAVLGTCSVGSLTAAMPVGTLLVPDDFYCASDLRRVYADYRGHFMPAIDAPARRALLAVLRGAGLAPRDGGVYVNSRGPRFETRAEVRAMAALGDHVGMTAAHECSACCEVGLPYAMMCLVGRRAAAALPLRAARASRPLRPPTPRLAALSSGGQLCQRHRRGALSRDFPRRAGRQPRHARGEPARRAGRAARGAAARARGGGGGGGGSCANAGCAG